MRPSHPMSLADAALTLGLTYHQVRAMVLQGTLRGGRDQFGRFYVEQSAVETALKRQRAKSPPRSHK